MKRLSLMLLSLLVPMAFVGCAPTVTSDYAQWTQGPPTDSDYFPIGVWVQDERNAAKYKAAGINVYVGLWDGPTAEQIEALVAANMPVVCALNEYGMTQLDNPLIIAWMQDDEPDNAQSVTAGDGTKGYGPPIRPEEMIARYHEMRKADPTRPIYMNLGQCVAWDNWSGRGVRRGHPEDYRQYAKACDIPGFDIYPVVSKRDEVAGKMWYVPFGVERLVRWSGGDKPIWTLIEASRIGHPEIVPTGEQVRAEVWMAIIAGSKGIVYFVHQFAPTFNEDSLLDNPELLAAVTKINKEVTELAPVINAPTVEGLVSTSEIAIRALTKRYDGATYVFAANLRNSRITATIDVAGLDAGTTIKVIGEDRTITADDGEFRDPFGVYGVHLYKITD